MGHVVIRFIALILLITSCSGGEAEPGKSTPKTPIVTTDRTDLLLSWFADGGQQVGSTVTEVPEHARREVRVQDPTVPPEDRDPNWIFLADLRKPGPLGRYPVRAERRDAYDARQQKIRSEAASPMSVPEPSLLSMAARVTPSDA